MCISESLAPLPFPLDQFIALGAAEDFNDIHVRVQEAIKTAGASQMVSDFPDGLKTYVGGTSGNELDQESYTLGRIIPPKSWFTPILVEEVQASEEGRGK